MHACLHSLKPLLQCFDGSCETGDVVHYDCSNISAPGGMYP